MMKTQYCTETFLFDLSFRLDARLTDALLPASLTLRYFILLPLDQEEEKSFSSLIHSLNRQSPSFLLAFCIQSNGNLRCLKG